MSMDLSVVSKLKARKTELSLPWDEMQRLESFLGETFGIEQPPTGYDSLERIRETCGNRIGEQFDQINENRAEILSWELPISLEDEQFAEREQKRFYDLISSDPLLGLVYSAKWSYIFDTAAYLTALIRIVGIDGPFIDIGCHAGYHALWLAKELGLKGIGVDRSKAAVRYARETAKRLGLTQAEISFDSRTITDRVPDGGYSLVYSSDGPMDVTKDSLGKVSKILANDGLFVCIGHLFESVEYMRDALSNAGMSLLLADVVGGWDSAERNFDGNPVFVIARGKAPEVSDDLEIEISTVWETGFADYCNTDGRAISEKVVSKYRSWRRYGPCPS
jgi:predicted O-methyltransferase YrrM